MDHFENRVAVITGAARGIGRALAERFAAEGAQVVLADIDEAALAETCEALRRGGAHAVAVPTDVTRPESVEALAARACDAFGSVHIVCNNAGVFCRGLPLWEQPLDEWEWLVKVNLFGVLHGIRSFVPILLEHGDEGHVVNTASMAGLLSLPMVAPYHATKHAVVTLSEALLWELRARTDRIGVTVLCPGVVRTDIATYDRTMPKDVRQSVGEPEFDRRREHLRHLIERGAEPRVAADAVLAAMRDGKLYAYTDPALLSFFEARAEAIGKGEAPPDPLSSFDPATRELFRRAYGS